jgi:hypothetical protein
MLNLTPLLTVLVSQLTKLILNFSLSLKGRTRVSLAKWYDVIENI